MVGRCQVLDVQEALVDIIPFLHDLVNVEGPTGEQFSSQLIQVLECVLESPGVPSEQNSTGGK